MTVTKRTRFEVLRRDNHTCRYCHATDSPLTVDHVTPVALGGSDNPDNLVAACKDCNAGKSSASPDSSLVADVRDEALRHAEMIRQAYAVVVARMGERDDYIEQFADEYTYTPMPDDWRNTIGRWFEMGVPIELITDAARIACSKSKTFYGDGRFAYMCGIVWNQVHVVNETVELKEAIDGAFLTSEDIDTISENEWRTGYTSAWRNWGFNDEWHRLLCNTIEGSYPERRQRHEENAPRILIAAKVVLAE